mmetsp:Transcript_85924/g.205954  ORF Transcript_85924/g.205954 Transcript_85924/m.205954 type:complete len:202 (-) Transcript_85924:115-720(-)
MLALFLTLLVGPFLEPRERHVCTVKVGRHRQVRVRGSKFHLHLLVQQVLTLLREVLAEADSRRGRTSGMHFHHLPVCRRLGRGTLQRTIDLLLHVRLDANILCRLRHAGQAVAILDLLLVEEGLVRLVHRALEYLAGAAGAGAGTASIGQIQPSFGGHIQNIFIRRALDFGHPCRGFQGNLVLHGNSFTEGLGSNARSNET